MLGPGRRAIKRNDRMKCGRSTMDFACPVIDHLPMPWILADTPPLAARGSRFAIFRNSLILLSLLGGSQVGAFQG